MHKCAVSDKLRGFEMIRLVWLEGDGFSVDHGLLTPTFKIKRGDMKERYGKEIKEMYASAPVRASKVL